MKYLLSLFIFIFGTLAVLALFYLVIAFHFYDFSWLSNELPIMRSVDRDAIITFFIVGEAVVVILSALPHINNQL